MPDHAESPRSSTHTPAQCASVLARRRLDAVLFDFHGTLAQVEEPVRWVTEAAASCGVSLDRGRATVLADRLVTVGRPGGPLPYRVPPPLAEAWADRDLDPYAHRDAYVGLARTVDCGVDGLAEALYERLLSPHGWVLYRDTLATLQALRSAGVPTAVVSNIGFDLRPVAAQLGLSDLIDTFVLSYEVGRCKPDPAIFQRACAALRVDPESALMVGDSPADAGAVAAGCPVLVLPAGSPGAASGITAVLDLVTAVGGTGVN